MIEIPKHFGNSMILFHLIDKFQPYSLNHLKRNEINKFQFNNNKNARHGCKKQYIMNKDKNKAHLHEA